MVTVAVLSRCGRATFAAQEVPRLDAAADVRYHALDAAPDHGDAVDMLEGADILAATNKCLPVLDAALLDALPRLRAVVLYATGYDHIDVDLLRRREIGLSVLEGYATRAVAEHAVALLFALATRLHLAHDRTRRLVPPDTSLRGVELADRTLGVIGVGRIGSEVARLGQAIGMSVLGTDTSLSAVRSACSRGVEMTGLDRVLVSSDAVVVCASHRFGAPALLGRAELRRMRPDAFLVNVARSALVDTSAAVEAIRTGALRGYAVDDEVLPVEHHRDVLMEGRVIQTGHCAWWRDETLQRGRSLFARQLLAAIAGRPVGAVTWPPTTGGSVDDVVRSEVVA